jgi:transposase
MCDRAPCSGRRATARRRHDSSHPRQGPDGDRSGLGICPRRPAVRWQGSSSGAVLCPRDRTRQHPERHLAGYAGILQADAFDGYNRLYLPDRKPGPIVEALCWSHARRKFLELADIAANARRSKTAAPISPIAFEAVRRIDALFNIEREINGLSAARRLAARQERCIPLVAALEGWMRAERARLSRHAAVAKAIDYMLTRWLSFSRFLEDGRICLSNNAAERALRGLALGRKSWLFAGSERGAERAALMYTLIQTARLNEIDPQAWLADVLARIAGHPAHRLDELLPWNWRALDRTAQTA